MTNDLRSLTLDQVLDILAEKIANRIGSSSSNSRRLMDVPTAAEYIGRSRAAVTHLIRKGVLPTIKLDGKIQIDRHALDRLIAAKTEW